MIPSLKTFRPTPAWLAVLAMAFAVFLAGVNRVPVPTVDGAIRADEARNVARTGRWFPVTFQGNTITDHPPFYVWTSAAAMKLFGVSDFAANFPQRLFAFLSVVATAAVAFEAGFGPAAAVLSAAVLCLTRDYVLSSVRGYIEPMLTFFVYAALWFVARHRRRGGIVSAAAAGLSVWLAFFSKGPPAAWPFLFFGALFLFPAAQKESGVLKGMGGYLAGFLLPTIAFVAWNTGGGYWDYWKAYLHGQVLASAVEGRAGAQHLEPLYFAGILVKYYWPWLPLLLWALYKAFFGARAPRGAMDREPVFWKRVFAITGLGFVAGFSLVKWKFWYYIAPAFPAFSLLIGTTFARFLAVAEDTLSTFCVRASCAWVLAVAVFPIPLHLERAPEVMAFRETIRGSAFGSPLSSPVAEPVWFVHSVRDHNIIGSSGQWYFEREVRKVSDTDERRWVETELRAPAWILTDKAHWNYCNSESLEFKTRPWMKSWCERSKLVQSEKGMALVLYL